MVKNHSTRLHPPPEGRGFSLGLNKNKNQLKIISGDAQLILAYKHRFGEISPRVIRNLDNYWVDGSLKISQAVETELLKMIDKRKKGRQG